MFIYQGCTAYAVQHRIRKIQAKASSFGDAAESPPVTPVKGSKDTVKNATPGKKTPKSTGKQATPRGGKRSKAARDNDNNVNADDEQSPSKKVKAKANIDTENEAYEDDYV